MVIKQNINIGRSGVQHYLHSEIYGGTSKKLLKFIRTPAEVKKVAYGLSGIPIYDKHTDEPNHKKIGEITKSHWDDELKTIKADLLFFNNDIEYGTELSLGYDADIIKKKDGYYQKNIEIDHLALVKNGRCGKICKIT